MKNKQVEVLQLFWTRPGGSLFGWLRRKLVVGWIRTKLGQSFRELGLQRCPEAVVVSRDTVADRSPPVVSAIPGLREGGSEIGVLAVRDHRLDDGFCLQPILCAFDSRVAVFFPARCDNELVDSVSLG